MDWIGEALSDAPLPVVAVVVVLILLAARELGTFLHGRLGAKADGPDHDSSDEGFILSGALGLLALLIAFTFGLALDRYEARRALVVSESDAISTAYTRFRQLDPADSARMSGLLAQYARTRLAYGRADKTAKPAWLATSRAERAAIENAALEIIRPIRATPLGPSLMASINDVSDRGADREAAQAARIPATVLEVLLVYTTVSAGILGYVLAGARSRHRIATAVLFLLLTLAICTILDLDRPREGAIQVSQQPMADLAASLKP